MITSFVVDRQKRFENATCGRGVFRKRRKKTSVFKNIWIRVNRQKRFENATCERGFFENGRKKPRPFSKISGYVWTAPLFNTSPAAKFKYFKHRVSDKLHFCKGGEVGSICKVPIQECRNISKEVVKKLCNAHFR